MTEEQKQQIKSKLLEFVKNGKLHLASNKILEIAKECTITPAAIVLYIQELFMKCDNDFKYEISHTRNGFKVTALDMIKAVPLDIIEPLREKSVYNMSLVEYINNQFSTLNFDILIQITDFYNTLSGIYDFSNHYLVAFSKSEEFYKNLENKYSKVEVDKILDFILNYGYAYKEDDKIFWKLYTPNIGVEDEKRHFLMDKQSVKKEKEETLTPIQEEPKIIQKETSVKEAIALIAKEYGMSLARDDSKYKLEELIATTNELVDSFNELPDWEKLKSWDTFMNSWQTIMGEAINDRN